MRYQWGLTKDIKIQAELFDVATGVPKTGLTGVTITVENPDGTSLTVSPNLLTESGVLTGIYRITIPAATFVQVGIYVYRINPNNAGTITPGAESFEHLGGPVFSSPTDGSLCTLSQVQDLLGSTSAAQDATINNLIPRISAFIQTYCNRKFPQANHTEQSNGLGSRSIILRHPPINSVASITIDGTSAVLTDFTYDSEAGILIKKNGFFSVGWQNVVVVYNGGFSLIPADIIRVASEATSVTASKYFRKVLGISSEVVGEGNRAITESDFLPQHLLTLNMWRLDSYGAFI